MSNGIWTTQNEKGEYLAFKSGMNYIVAEGATKDEAILNLNKLIEEEIKRVEFLRNRIMVYVKLLGDLSDLCKTLDNPNNRVYKMVLSAICAATDGENETRFVIHNKKDVEELTLLGFDLVSDEELKDVYTIKWG